MTPAKQTHIMDPDQATQTVAQCVCSGCYDQLIQRYDWHTRTSEVTCVTENCDTPGFVSRSWVEQQKANNLAEAHEARQVLQNAAPWMKPEKKSTDQLLKELGF
jgi:hypothetical protein